LWKYAVVGLAIWLLSGPVTASTPNGEIQKSCGYQVRAYDENVAAAFRRELLTATEEYCKHFGPVALASNLLPGPLPELLNPPAASVSVGGHIISFGSGPDIIRPIYNFPFASHYHLFDIMEGWYGGGALAFRELERRLYQIHPGVIVERIDPGFLEFGSPEIVDHFPPSSYRKGSSPYAGKVTWRLKWKSPAAGQQLKLVTLHLKDYSRLKDGLEVLAQVPKGQLDALFISGAFLPKGKALVHYLSEVKSGGLFIADMDFSNAVGESTTAAQDVVSKAVIQLLGYKIESFFPRDEKIAAQNPYDFFPNTYRFIKNKSQN
jgi:hypothetical protein